MKATKYIFFLTLLLGVLSCSEDDTRQEGRNITPFVRFHLLVNSNNDPIVYPDISASARPVSTYTNNSLKPLKIPVSLTYQELNKTVTANYDISTTLDPEAYEITPEILRFEAGQLTDTIQITLKKRWEGSYKIDLALTSVSDKDILIGNPNTEYPNTTLQVNLEEVNTTCSFETGRMEITGSGDEEISFKVNFPKGYIASEIDENAMFSSLSDFGFSLFKKEEKADAIIFGLELQEALTNDDRSYQNIITLLPAENYEVTGTSRLQIVKPIRSDRDVNANPASHFYNPEDIYYRTYGENWLDHDNDGECEWRSFFAFTHPVPVTADHPNAVLYSDNGTTDPSDDTYYDAFRIGFSSPLDGRTTNPFNLQRWFDNESSGSDISPGFNISPALEFYPENGDDADKGTVIVISQFITIGNREGKQYEFTISGEGEYFINEQGIYEIALQLRVKNEELYGGTVTSEYRMYNANGYSDPIPPSGANCISEIPL